MTNIRRQLILWLVASTTVMLAADPTSNLKKLHDEGIGASVVSAINACQPLAPAPFGNFVPANVIVPVPAATTTVGPIAIAGPFPVTIPMQTIAIPTNSVTIPGSAFLPPASRLCPVAATGDTAGDPPQPPGKSHFDLRLVIDFSTYRANGSGGGCSLTSGQLTLVKQDSGAAQDTLSMTHAGLLCDTAGIGSAKTYTATYHIVGGTQKYTGASGTGNFSASFDASSTLIHLDGNVLFQ